MVPMMIMIPVVPIALALLLPAFSIPAVGVFGICHCVAWFNSGKTGMVGCKKYLPVMSHAMLAPPPVVSPSSAVPEGTTQAQHFISFMTTNRR